MFENVVDQTNRLIYAADMLLAATWEAKNVGELESALNGMLAEVEYKFKDLPVEQLEEEARRRRRKAGVNGRFHWPLEFPEVFIEWGGFDAFVCNPPYLGGKRIRTELGDAYSLAIKSLITPGEKGASDLCAYFLRRGYSLPQSTWIDWSYPYQFRFPGCNTANWSREANQLWCNNSRFRAGS